MQDIVNTIGWPTIAMVTLLVLVIIGVIWREAVQTAFYGLAVSLGWLWVLILWVFPPVIMGIAWLFPELHQVVAFPVPQEVLGSLWIPAIIGVVWFAAQWASAQNANTSFRTLQRDLVVSILWAYLFNGIAVHQFALGNLQYWELLPAIFTSLEALLNAHTAINNAFQKNPTQMQKGE